jgi:hypothetical protein
MKILNLIYIDQSFLQTMEEIISKPIHYYLTSLAFFCVGHIRFNQYIS